MKAIKKGWESNQKINTETCLRKGKTKRENMEKTDTIICLKKKNRLKLYQKNNCEAKKSLNIIMNKIVF